MGIPFTAPEGPGTLIGWTPLDTRSLELITRARFRRWTNASVTTRPAARTFVVCAGLRGLPAPIAGRRRSHGCESDSNRDSAPNTWKEIELAGQIGA
jgi:hypothetical protein